VSDLSQSLIDAAAAKIGSALHDETGGCHCEPFYSERGRADPGCVYCQAGGDGFGPNSAPGAVAAVLETLAAEGDPVQIGPGMTDQKLLTNADLRRLAAEVKGEQG
jgi:hypothetical protein